MEAYPLLSNINLPDDIKKLSYSQLEDMAKEVRSLIIDVVSKNGGHLAPALGVIELTIALLRFTSPLNDRIIWDVGHQSYAFKILTDRFKTFKTLRTYGGISGFSKIDESPYDAFGTGHASTSISAGMGIAAAADILGIKKKVISVIGDGALSGGIAFEALNNLGMSKKNMIVILNDNKMSISENVGAISISLSRMATGQLASSVRNGIINALSSPIAPRIKKLLKKVEDGMVSFFTLGTLFEEFGLRYIGPIDGHNINEIEKALSVAQSHNGPCIIHAITVKGKGYKYAEDIPSIYHGVSQFDIETGEIIKDKMTSPTWTKIFSDKLLSMAKTNKKIVAITAAMSDGTGMTNFFKLFPDRFFDTGIAEQHAITFAAGLASAGMLPYVAIYSTFLQRAFDQIIHDVSIQNLPVRICIDRAGLVGQDGPTHHGAFDISFLKIIPNLRILMPRDSIELEDMLELSQEIDGPLVIRYPRGEAFYDSSIPRSSLELDKPEVVYEGSECLIISAGHSFEEAIKFRNYLTNKGVSTGLINIRFINPINLEPIYRLASEVKSVFTFEENIKTGGFGEMLYIKLKNKFPKLDINILAIPEGIYIPHGTQKELKTLAGITSENAIKIFENKNNDI